MYRPDLAEQLACRANAAIELRRFQDALRLATEALGADPGSASAHAAMACSLLNLQRAREAVPYAREAVRLDPENGWHLRLLALTDYRQEKFQACLATVEKILQSNPADVNAWNLRGDALLAIELDLPAEQSFQMALSIAPNSVDALAGLARCAFIWKEWSAAESLLKKALAIEPQSAIALRLLAICYRHQRKRDAEALANKAALLAAPHSSQLREQIRDAFWEYLNAGFLVMIVFPFVGVAAVAALAGWGDQGSRSANQGSAPNAAAEKAPAPPPRDPQVVAREWEVIRAQQPPPRNPAAQPDVNDKASRTIRALLGQRKFPPGSPLPAVSPPPRDHPMEPREIQPILSPRGAWIALGCVVAISMLLVVNFVARRYARVRRLRALDPELIDIYERLSRDNELGKSC